MRQRHLVSLGLRVGGSHAAMTFLISYMRHDGISVEVCLVLLVIYFSLCLPALLFGSDRQLDWYRRALFIPWSAVYGAILLAAADGQWGLLGAVAVWGAVTVVPAAPVVWLVGALWIWRSNRRGIRPPAR